MRKRPCVPQQKSTWQPCQLHRGPILHRHHRLHCKAREQRLPENRPWVGLCPHLAVGSVLLLQHRGPSWGWGSPWPCATTSSSSGLSCGASAGLPSASFHPTAAALGPRRQGSHRGAGHGVGGGRGGRRDSRTPRAAFREAGVELTCGSGAMCDAEERREA